MGWGIGISIGWPASTGTNKQVNSGHWRIDSYCPGIVASNTFTNYKTDVNWLPGDYVSLVSSNARVRLGDYYGEEAPFLASIENVTRTVYNSCEE